MNHIDIPNRLSVTLFVVIGLAIALSGNVHAAQPVKVETRSGVLEFGLSGYGCGYVI